MTQHYAPDTESSIFTGKNGEKVIEEKRLPSNYLFVMPRFMEDIQIAASKLGYTTQHPNDRIQQWKHESPIYEDIKLVAVHPAYFDTDDGERVYYLDHALHRLLRMKHHEKLVNLQHIVARYPNDHISQELYYNTLDPQQPITAEYFAELAADLKTMYLTGTAPSDVKFYTDFKSSAATIARTFQPVHSFEPRAFQEAAIQHGARYFLDKFTAQYQDTAAVELSVAALERSFLLSAPTRSGKSFMAAMMSKRIVEQLKKLGKTQNVILVVSGIADVMIEWQKAYQEHTAFNQKNSDGSGTTLFQFITRSELLEKGTRALDEAFANGAENVVIALTLQDLSGSFKASKNESFIAHDFLKPREDGSSPVDLLIVDEAHFAAFNRFGEYRSMIAPTDYDSAQEHDGDVSDAPLSQAEFEEASEEFQQIEPSVGTLYVSATPYNELLGGDTFSVERGNMHIISKHDIQREAEAWRREFPHLPEWYSPYFGLPQQHYFAVDTGQAIDTILEVDSSGEFISPDAAHSLVWNFVGEKYTESYLFPKVLNDPVYVQAGLGKHVLITVGSCAQADAVEESFNMLQEVNAAFKQQYKIMNFSSDDSSHFYRSKTSYDIAREIQQAEEEGVYTISITVDRLGTGVTVEEWDTVVFWREMSSAQKFDQLAGRVGTPFVVTMTDDEGNVMKRCEKPNVAVLSYAPEQMLEIVHENAQTIARVKQREASQKSLKELVDEELSVVPTYMLAAGETRMARMTANNILDSVLAALKGKGPREYAKKVLVNIASITSDRDLLQQVLQLDASEDGKLALNIKAMEAPEPADGECHFIGCESPAVESYLPEYGDKYCAVHVVFYQDLEEQNTAKARGKQTKPEADGEAPITPETAPSGVVKKAEEERKSIENRVRNFVSVLLMFVSLSPNDEHNLKDVIASIEDPTNDTGRRIAHHLGLDLNFLKAFDEAGTFNHTLDTQFYLIQETLARLDASSTIDEIWDAMTILIEGFGNFSANEIPTPETVARLLVDKAGLTDEFWKNAARRLQKNESIVDIFQQVVPGTAGDSGISVRSSDRKIRFIDNGCKSAIIFVEIARRAERYGIPLDMFEFYAIPTSPATYELIRKVYELMGWNLDHIFFIEGIEPLDVNNLVEITIEQQDGCQRRDDSCVFHNWTGVKLRREYGIDHIEIPSKTADDEAWNTFTAQAFDDAFEHVFDSIEDRELHVAARDTWGRMKPTIEKFDYAISNPPYQLETRALNDEGVGDSKNIFPLFQTHASFMSKKTSMIYPGGRWIRGTGKGCRDFGKELLNDDFLQSIDLYLGQEAKELFPSVSIGDGLSIVYWDSKKPRRSFYLNSEEFEKKENVYIPFGDRGIIEIVNRINQYSLASLNDHEFSRKRIKFNDANAEAQKAQPINNGDNSKPKDFKNPIKAFINNTSGKKGRVGLYWIENSVTENSDVIDKWKVVMNSNVQGNEAPEDWRFHIIESGVLYGSQRIPVNYLSTQEEAEFFHAYVNSKLVRQLVTAAGGSRNRMGHNLMSFVPDLKNYTNNNPVFTPDIDLPDGHEYKGLSLDERLYKLFKLTEEEIAIIEQS